MQDPNEDMKHRIECIKAWRQKFQSNLLGILKHKDYVETGTDKPLRLVRDAIYQTMPFVFAQAVVLVFIKYIRHGEFLLRMFDPDLVQLHQVIFMEVVGFKVDAKFIAAFLRKHKVINQQEAVHEFMGHYREYIRRHC